MEFAHRNEAGIVDGGVAMATAAISSPTEYIKRPNANGILIDVMTCEYARYVCTESVRCLNGMRCDDLCDDRRLVHCTYLQSGGASPYIIGK